MLVTDLIAKMLAPVQRRVRLMVARGVIKLVDDSKKLQSVQVAMRADELRDDAEHFQHYGYSSVPQAGSEAIVLLVGGNSDHPVVISIDDRRYRPKDLSEGEVCLYTLANGKRVLCKADGKIEIGTSPTQFAALANLVKSELDSFKSDLDAFKSWNVAHQHVETGATTNAPSTAGAHPTAHTPASVASSEVKIK